jgi:hypothetical protein
MVYLSLYREHFANFSKEVPMAKFIVVDRKKVKAAMRKHNKLLEKNTQARKERQEFQSWVTKEKKHRDTEYKTGKKRGKEE